MIASIPVSPACDMQAIARLAGQSDPDTVSYVDGFLIVEGVTQERLGAAKDAALAGRDWLAEAIAAKQRELAAARYITETGGVVIAGATIRTDRESQAQLSSAYTSLKAGLISSTEWKASDGWATVTLAEIEPIAKVVAQHVAACFARERRISELAAAAGAAAELAGIDWQTVAA